MSLLLSEEKYKVHIFKQINVSFCPFFGSKRKVVGGKRIDLKNTYPVYHSIAAELVLVFKNAYWFHYRLHIKDGQRQRSDTTTSHFLQGALVPFAVIFIVIVLCIE